ncbi:MAG: glycosyltransferase family 2 protein, partial [Gammaproteobacteria bacterium]|nr:glycosyltransferase family 2 protein [Gammaproteobacteria bacterium]
MTAQAHQRLTLIVCTRDRLAQLRATLDCILRLRCREPWQLVVVDNGSSDGTLPWLQSLQSTPAVRVEVTSEPIQGVSRARNQGLTLAVGEIVAFTDDDCYPVGSFLDDLLVAFAPGDLDYCGGRLILHDPGDRPVSLRTSTTPAAYAPGSFVPAGAICGANMAFRRKTLEVIGPFDVALGAGAATCAGEDTDLVFRASWAGFRGAYLPHLLVRHHHGRRSAAAARATDT